MLGQRSSQLQKQQAAQMSCQLWHIYVKWHPWQSLNVHPFQ